MPRPLSKKSRGVWTRDYSTECVASIFLKVVIVVSLNNNILGLPKLTLQQFKWDTQLHTVQYSISVLASVIMHGVSRCTSKWQLIAQILALIISAWLYVNACFSIRLDYFQPLLLAVCFTVWVAFQAQVQLCWPFHQNCPPLRHTCCLCWFQQLGSPLHLLVWDLGTCSYRVKSKINFIREVVFV